MTALHKQHRRCLVFVSCVIVSLQALFLIALANLPELIGLDCSKEKEDKVERTVLLEYNNTSQNATIQSPYLPRRLLTVFGLESSGTTFVTELLERSTGVKHSVHENFREYQVQHASLPSGMKCQGQIRIIPVLYPAICKPATAGMTLSNKKRSSQERQQEQFVQCPELMNNDVAPPRAYYEYPVRYFVNISSHIQWYRDRGVDATAVLVIRDKTIGSVARSLTHCDVPEFQKEEEVMGKRIMKDAMEQWGNQPLSSVMIPALVVVSYETLVHMGATYLNLILGQLQLPRIHEPLEWAFEDGNERYIQPREHIKKTPVVRKPTVELKPDRNGDDDDIDGRLIQGPLQSSNL
ncbi:hypothetical protein MHU86_3224 [Fragilaria crotonensis]|nr:hypothetical protein MHU86_3224 [Fragilaria crotonensis]